MIHRLAADSIEVKLKEFIEEYYQKNYELSESEAQNLKEIKIRSNYLQDSWGVLKSYDKLPSFLDTNLSTVENIRLLLWNLSELAPDVIGYLRRFNKKVILDKVEERDTIKASWGYIYRIEDPCSDIQESK